MACSVSNCYSKRYNSQQKLTFFLVKDSWLSSNPLGWKPHKIRRICMNHFRKEDIINLGTKQPFVKKKAIPQIFQNYDYNLSW